MTQGSLDYFQFKLPVRKMLIEGMGLEKVNQLEKAWEGNEDKIMAIIKPYLERYDRAGWAKDVFGR